MNEETITRDLEAMKQNGFGGLLVFDARGYHDDLVPMPPSKVDFMSPQWRQMLKFAIEKAAKLELEVSVNRNAPRASRAIRAATKKCAGWPPAFGSGHRL